MNNYFNYCKQMLYITYFQLKRPCTSRLPKCPLVEKLGLSWNLQVFLLRVDGFLIEMLPQRLHFLLSTISASVKDFMSGLVCARRFDCIDEIIVSYRSVEFLCGIQF